MLLYRILFRDRQRHVQAELLFQTRPTPERLADALAKAEICSHPVGKHARETRYHPALASLPAEPIHTGGHAMWLYSVLFELTEVVAAG